MVLRLGILISGRGSNMVNIVEACYQKKINAQVEIIISNNESSEGLKKVKKYKCNIKIIKSSQFKNKIKYEEKIDKSLKKVGFIFSRFNRPFKRKMRNHKIIFIISRRIDP